MVLCGAEDDFLLIMATVCKSYVSINKETNHRDMMTPEGDIARGYVQCGSLMLERLLASKIRI